MRKVLINIILLILAFTIQICVFPQIAFLSSAPNLLLISVFICGFIEGKEAGFSWIFFTAVLLAFIPCFTSIWDT